MGEFVNLEVTDGVGVLRLNRPPMNALSRQVVTEITEAAQQIATSEEVRALVIWGGEKIFAAGADIKEFTAQTAGGMLRYGQFLQRAFVMLAELPQVTIAAVNGYALGGGCELAMTADFRFAAEDAVFGQPEIKLGIIPGAGGTQRLPRLVGLSRAKDIIFSGRFVKADEALSIGLADQVHPGGEVFDRAMEAARGFAAGPLVALKAAKMTIDRGSDVDIDTGLTIERAVFATLFATEDREIGVKAFIEKQEPKFTGR